MRFLAVDKTGHILSKGAEIRTTRDNEPWIFQSVTHPRKLYVTWDNDPNGAPFYPNRANREFYASVFDLGIWDIELQEWSFNPNFDNPDIEDELRTFGKDRIGTAVLGETDILWNSDERLDLEDMYHLYQEYLSEQDSRPFKEWLLASQNPL
jgi:hypothetical protein